MRRGALAALFATACSRRTSDPVESLADCFISGERSQLKCGTLEVRENPDDPASKSLTLHYVVAPAKNRTSETSPVFFLAGGPGQSAIEVLPRILPAFAETRKHHDIVFLDQRGTGKSAPLGCEIAEKHVPNFVKFSEDLHEDRVRTCAKSYAYDPVYFTTTEAVRDLDQVRQKLGAKKINLWGGSYGTRVGLAYATAFPESTARVVLDGMAPQEIKLPFFAAKDAENSWKALLQSCEREAPCKAAFPTLDETFRSVLQSLEAAPETVSALGARSGTNEPFVITRTIFASMIRNALYSPTTSRLVPLLVYAAARKDFNGLVALADTYSDEEVAMGMFLSVVCKEDVPFYSEREIENETQGTFLGKKPASDWKKLCALWPSAKAKPQPSKKHALSMPALLFSGDHDPITPSRWGDVMQARFSNAKHVKVPASGHIAIGVGCVPNLLAKFYDGADLGALDTSCVDKAPWPTFFVTPGGPK